MADIPSDPFILLSYINSQLRDNFPDFDELCKSLDIERNDIISKLSAAGFEYDRMTNQFK